MRPLRLAFPFTMQFAEFAGGVTRHGHPLTATCEQGHAVQKPAASLPMRDEEFVPHRRVRRMDAGSNQAWPSEALSSHTNSISA